MGAQVFAGPSNSVVVDKQGMNWMAGKVCSSSSKHIDTLKPSLRRAVEKQWRRHVHCARVYLLLMTCLRDRFCRVAILVIPVYARNHVRYSLISQKTRVLTRLPVRGCKISLARCGGVTHWAVTPDDDGSPMTVCWGQNASNGMFLPQSASRPKCDDDEQANLA